MPASPSSLSYSTVVTRLRAAGCVFAEDEARLLIDAAQSPADLAAMVDRRAAGLPLEYVVGWAEFCGLRIAVEPGVFVPRRRTEFLVGLAIDLARPPTVVVDLCCGSGAVGAALAAALGGIELHSSDVDPAAVRCAGRNVSAVGGRVYEGDLFEPLPAALRGRVGILAANVPYVPTEAVDTLPAEARLHEPRVALDGGGDGLDVLRRVAAGAPLGWRRAATCWSRPASGRLHAPPGSSAGSGLTARVAGSDDPSATVVIGTRPAVGEGPVG